MRGIRSWALIGLALPSGLDPRDSGVMRSPRAATAKGRAMRDRSSLCVAAILSIGFLFSSTASHAQQCGDLDNSGGVFASDALLLLKKAVGQPVDLICAEDCAALEVRVAQLESLLVNLSVQGDNLVLTGMNFQIVDGSGDTAGEPNGRGNLIVGYNEDDDDVPRVFPALEMLV
jgi:hypothetical protein